MPRRRRRSRAAPRRPAPASPRCVPGWANAATSAAQTAGVTEARIAPTTDWATVTRTTAPVSAAPSRLPRRGPRRADAGSSPEPRAIAAATAAVSTSVYSGSASALTRLDRPDDGQRRGAAGELGELLAVPTSARRRRRPPRPAAAPAPDRTAASTVVALGQADDRERDRRRERGTEQDPGELPQQPRPGLPTRSRRGSGQPYPGDGPADVAAEQLDRAEVQRGHHGEDGTEPVAVELQVRGDQRQERLHREQRGELRRAQVAGEPVGGGHRRDESKQDGGEQA